MDIRKAVPSDIPELLRIYSAAREYMKKTGNTSQWRNGYPQREMLENDIGNGSLYVLFDADGLHGSFMFNLGIEPTYIDIDGVWLNDESYGYIHRIASDGTIRGVFAYYLAFCSERCKNLRADTHKDNLTMQHLFEKNGFIRCGVITLADGSKRLAYHKII